MSSSSFDSSLLVRDARRRYEPATAELILDASRQVLDRRMQRGAAFTTPHVVQDFLRTKLADLEREVFAVICLDRRHRLIEYAELFHGTIDVRRSAFARSGTQCAVHSAAAAIIGHDHSSGNPEPSVADRAVTLRLKQALALVDVRLLDHIAQADKTRCPWQTETEPHRSNGGVST